MPSIGVYPLEYDMLTFLLAKYQSVDNTALIASLVSTPFLEFRDQLATGSHPYIVRELHRECSERLEKLFDVDVPLPTWEEMNSDAWWDLDRIGSWAYAQSPSWYIFSNDVDTILEIFDAAHGELEDGDLKLIIEKFLDKAERDGKRVSELYVVSEELDAIYVVRSPTIAYCAEARTSATGFHAFEDIADARSEGTIPAYVLSDAFLARYDNYLAQGAA